MTLSFYNPPSLLRYDDGERELILRPARFSDAEEVVEALQESMAELRAFMPWAHAPQTVAIQQERLQAIEATFGSGGDIVFHLYEHQNGAFVGCLGLHAKRSLNPHSFEIGYWTRTRAAGRGIVTLATQCAVVFGFECFGAQRIQCGYNEANAGSARVNEKVGFIKEGRLRAFELQPTAQMQADGCQMLPHMVMSALFPEDRARLDWYAGVASHLTVLNEVGRLVGP
jgi:RimJ/RimL family protein N-acetyltransferase